MNKQSNSSSDQQMNKSQNSATSATKPEQSLSAKQQASKSQFGTLTAKSDANNDYE